MSKEFWPNFKIQDLLFNIYCYASTGGTSDALAVQHAHTLPPRLTCLCRQAGG